MLAHFDRERIPERVVHAKGSGAHGTFEVTDPIPDLTCAEFLGKKGKVSATARFSTVGGESGSADTARDPRGFSVKLRTEQGIWDHVYVRLLSLRLLCGGRGSRRRRLELEADLLPPTLLPLLPVLLFRPRRRPRRLRTQNNTPVFFLRDPAKFPRFIHTQKRDPQTHLKDADHFWDYLSQEPEAFHQVMILFGDRGVPDGYRFMHGYSGHTHKLVKADGSFVYAQFHYQSRQGTKFLTQEESVKIAGENPDYAGQDLFESIEKGEYPSWDFCVQTMTPEQAEKFRYNILDLTKIWSHKEFPLRKVGVLTLNESASSSSSHVLVPLSRLRADSPLPPSLPDVKNYFAEVEQVAFAPSHLIPGVEPSADPVLQSRLFSYPDAHRYRLCTSHLALSYALALVVVVPGLQSPWNFAVAGSGLRAPRASTSFSGADSQLVPLAAANYAQLPVNAPLNLPANFQRDGTMAFHNQGARPNYKSTMQKLSYKPQPYQFDKHEQFVGNLCVELSEVTELDFEQPRQLWEKVFDDGARERFINNVAGHLGGAKSDEIKQRTLSVLCVLSLFVLALLLRPRPPPLAHVLLLHPCLLRPLSSTS